MNIENAEERRLAGPSPEATVLAFIVIIATTALTIALSAAISGGTVDPWYGDLNLAPGAPPGQLYAVVFPTLYTLMAVGACMVWRVAGWKGSDAALGIYFLQLLANLGWSILFFRYHLGLAALIDLIALWVLVALLIREFRRHSRVAAQLQYPYLAWVTYALYLNAWIVFAN